jgi:hypothetical protein
MPRANRYFVPGHIWHITHERCSQFQSFQSFNRFAQFKSFKPPAPRLSRRFNRSFDAAGGAQERGQSAEEYLVVIVSVRSML